MENNPEMATHDSSLRFRKATASDLEGIASISVGINEKSDSLVYLFPKWLNDERRYLFIAETACGQLVGFTSINITDNGRSAIIRFSRVDIAYRGRGVYRSLLDFTLRAIRELLPNLNNILRYRPKIVDNYDCLAKVTKLTLVCNLNTRKHLVSKIQEGTQFTTWQEFQDLYSQSQLIRNMFPSDYLRVNAELFNLSISMNWEYLKTRDDLLLLLTRRQSDTGYKLAAFSVWDTAIRTTNQGEKYFGVDIYGSDPEAILGHVLRGMQVVFDKIGGTFNVGFWVAEENVNYCLELFQKFQFCEIVQKVPLLFLKRDLVLQANV
ncbi:uncharacterized protein LOC135685517 [Rhopilema esculentum]|uniref:uncharacterized protein LOC135685517 n=1 Tax=Rhopilema esculentum TaxID=499914 RepID=UPI0031DBE289